MTKTEITKHTKDPKRQLPDSWRWVRLGEVCQFENGFAFKSSEYKSTGLRVIRICNVQKGKIVDTEPQFIDSNRREEFRQYEIHAGDLLISLTGNVGRVGIFPKELTPALLNQRVGKISLKDSRLVLDFLFYYLHDDGFEKAAIASAIGMAQLNLSTKWIAQCSIPLPPLPEQRRIAGVLREQMAAVEKARVASEEELKTINSLPAALLRRAFHGEV